MKVLRKFIGSLSLDHVPDAADESHVAVSNTAQTFEGLKKLYGVTRVKQDPLRGDKNLICRADVDDLLNKLPKAKTESVELTAEHISSKGITLSKGSAEGYAFAAKCKCEGSGWLFAGFDFDLSDKALSWSNYPHILAKLQIGDKMVVRYIAKGGE